MRELQEPDPKKAYTERNYDENIYQGTQEKFKSGYAWKQKFGR